MTSSSARLTLIIAAMRRALWPLLALVPAYARIFAQLEDIARRVDTILAQLRDGQLPAAPPIPPPTSGAPKAKPRSPGLRPRQAPPVPRLTRRGPPRLTRRGPAAPHASRARHATVTPRTRPAPGHAMANPTARHPAVPVPARRARSPTEKIHLGASGKRVS